MKIIVESGATKTDWRAVASDGTLRSFQTEGLNPSCLDDEHVRDVVRQAVPVLNPEGAAVTDIDFYGAGLVSQEAVAPLRDALELWCPFADIRFHSDILAAARALFADDSGVVAIMGTGSNSCLYEDGKVVMNIRPGGFVLGDEGSGAALGKAFLADFIKGLVPKYMADAFTAEYGLDYARIVQKVYKEDAASAFLASLAPFVMKNVADEYVSGLLEECLESFVVRSLSRYSAYASDKAASVKVGVVGSFGCACEPQLKQLGARYGLEFVRFIKSPVDELVKYHGI